MNVANSIRRLSKASQYLKFAVLPPSRNFHSTIPINLRASPTLNGNETNNSNSNNHNSSSNNTNLARSSENTVAGYTDSQLRELLKFYSPEQLESLLAGEAAIDPADFARRRPRDPNDAFGLRGFTDLSKFDPHLDFPVEGQRKLPVRGYPEQPLPIINDPSLNFPNEEDSSNYRLEDLTRLTGFTAEQLRRFMVRRMVFHRVVNQTRMGKIQRFYALNIAGNGNGLLGVGEGKSAEAGDAVQIASYMALRNMEPIQRYEGRTIYGTIDVKIGAVELRLRAAPPGYGVRASEPIFEMCRCVGITDLSAKITRSRNRMNVVKAVMHGFRNQTLPETIARGRGLKLVDVRKVYYGGANQQNFRYL